MAETSTELATFHSVYCCQFTSIINMSFNTLPKCGTEIKQNTQNKRIMHSMADMYELLRVYVCTVQNEQA